MKAPRELPRALALILAAALAGCGSDGGRGGGGAESVRAPASAGDVWEIARPADRATAAVSMLAYLHGLHVIVLDGEDAYAGMTRLRGERDTDGAIVVPLADGATATMTPEGDGMQLRFSTGETVAFKKRGTS